MKTVPAFKPKDWVSVQPKKKNGQNNGPRVNGIVQRVNRKGYQVLHEPNCPRASFNSNSRAVLKTFPLSDVQLYDRQF